MMASRQATPNSGGQPLEQRGWEEGGSFRDGRKGWEEKEKESSKEKGGRRKQTRGEMRKKYRIFFIVIWNRNKQLFAILSETSKTS